jgi:hypothetical protein
MTEITEVWLWGFDEINTDCAYLTEDDARKVAEAAFADSWVSEHSVETAWRSYPEKPDQGVLYMREVPRAGIYGGDKSPPSLNTGFFVRRVPIAEVTHD